MKLTGQAAIVTGGGRGIGRAICLALAREGADVVVAARTRVEVEQVAAEVRGLGRKGVAVTVDIRDPHGVASMADAAIAAFGQVDVLVNNAAINHPSCPVAELDPGTWGEVLAVNLTGTFLCCRAVLAHMIPRRRGKIINIASIGGRRGGAGRSAYRASKAAVLNLTESLSAEVKQLGINVNAVCPGGVSTRMLTETFGEAVPGLMAPEDIAAVTIFLASDDARALHGAAVDAFGVASEVGVVR